MSKFVIDNDEEGVTFAISDSTEYHIDHGAADAVIVTPQKDGEYSVVYPADAWVTVYNGRLCVKFAKYGDTDAPCLEIYPEDLN